jgi:hypothetical protein
MVAGRNENSLQPTTRRHEPCDISSAQMKSRSDNVLARAKKVGDLFALVEKLKQKLPKKWTA